MHRKVCVPLVLLAALAAPCDTAEAVDGDVDQDSANLASLSIDKAAEEEAEAEAEVVPVQHSDVGQAPPGANEEEEGLTEPLL